MRYDSKIDLSLGKYSKIAFLPCEGKIPNTRHKRLVNLLALAAAGSAVALLQSRAHLAESDPGLFACLREKCSRHDATVSSQDLSATVGTRLGCGSRPHRMGSI